MPQVSIIVPVYNVEKYLPNCLDSILNQSFQDIEIICVNDASPDNSAQILKQYAQKDERIKIITHKKNEGLGAARNTGVAHANAPYLAFIDSDDTIKSTFTEVLYNAIIANNADMSWCGIANTNEQGDLLYYNNIPEKNWQIPEILNCLELHPGILPVWNKLFKYELFKGIKQLPIISEDLPAVAEYITKSKKIVTVNKPLYNYRKRTGTLSSPGKQKPEHWDDFFYSNGLSLEILRKSYSSKTLSLQTIIRASSIFWRIETHQMYLSNSWSEQKNIIRNNILSDSLKLKTSSYSMYLYQRFFVALKAEQKLDKLIINIGNELSYKAWLKRKSIFEICFIFVKLLLIKLKRKVFTKQ